MNVGFRNLPARRVYLVAALEGLTRTALVDLATEDLPSLYESNVKYRPEPKGSECWLRPSQVLRSGFGDCEDLAAWRTGEIRRAGERGAFVDVVRTGPKRWHAVVRRESGAIEDPTKILKRLGRSVPAAFKGAR